MTRKDQERIRDVAVRTLKQDRSVEEILETLQTAGIVDKSGKVKSPYKKILVKNN